MQEPWRKTILDRLQTRNRSSVEPFADLITLHNRTFEGTNALRTENAQLVFINEKLKQENLDLKTRVGSGGTSAESSERIQALEKKLYSVQEELTELHRRKGENAQQVIDLTVQLKEAEKTLKNKDDLILRYENEIEVFRTKIRNLTSAISELESTNQLLKDEYQTIQLALNTAEGKLIAAQKENDSLIAQVMEFKEKDVERMNMENEIFNKRKQEILQKQLAEAAKEHKPVRAIDGACQGQEVLASLICDIVRIPTRAYLKFEAHDGEVNAIKWSPHQQYVATGGSDRKIKLWEISRGSYESRGMLTGSNGAIMSLDFDSAGTLLLGSSVDFASRVWTVEDKRLRHTLTGHSGKVLSAKFLGDANKVASGSHDRTIKVWDLRSKACISTKFPGSSCNDLVAQGEQNIVSGHFDKKIRMWDARTGAEPVSEVILGGKVTSVDVSKDGNWVLACCRDDTLKLIDVRTCQVVKAFFTEGFHVGCDWTRAQISPDSQYVCVGGSDGTIFIWNIDDSSRPETALVREHSAPVVSVAWQPAGNGLTTCDKNKTVVVWADI